MSLLLAALAVSAQSKPIRIDVHANQVLHAVSKDLFGIFFEEINCAGDGGIYPELVRNRSFEDSNKPDFWALSKGIDAEVVKGKLHIKADTSGTIENHGYWGMNLRQGQKYHLQVTGDFPQACQLRVEVVDGGRSIAAANLKFLAGKGHTQLATLIPNASSTSSSLRISVGKGQSFALDYVSLFPVNTYKERKNGLRPELMDMLHGLKPAFMRFPGGCWVEGDRMASAYRWKTTINNLETRRTVPNLWGYLSTNGLGYHEYLQMCEDLGAAPLFVVNCGMSHKEVVPLGQMDEYVQDALDAIEYANGPVTSKWGAIRAKNGHPKSFHLKYLEIGNENGGPAYAERYKLIYDAVKAKYPEIKTIADVWGGTPNSAPVEAIDEHYYNSPGFFFSNANRYDSYDRKGPKVYVGEYAVTQGSGQGNHIGALAEAAFMTGLERNSDHVVMASYAPLFANVNAKAWNPDLICFDSSRVYGTPSYFVQKLFSENRATDVVKCSSTKVPENKTPFGPGGIGVGTWETVAEYKDLQLIENGRETKIEDPTWEMKRLSGHWEFEGGLLRQTTMEDGARCFFPSPQSSRYTFKLKAKKISGKEGFLILVGAKNANNYMWINLGGWTNTTHATEQVIDGNKSKVGRSVDGVIETGRWYDIEVQYSPDEVKCLLDGKTVIDEKPQTEPKFFYTAGIDKAKWEVVVKCVHALPTSQDVEIDISGLSTARSGYGFVLSNSNPLAENSLGNPRNDVPSEMKVAVRAGKLKFTAKPYSLTILRVPIR